MKKNKNTALIIVVLLLVVGITCGYVASTYAKYTSQITGKSATATVAKWSFVSDNESKTFTMSLDETYDPDTLVANKIAPGTSGKFEIELSNANSEVGVNYDVVIAATGVPTNLKFYTDAAHTTLVSNNKVSGTLTPGQASQTVTIYWMWAYETTDGDAADTTDGTNAGTMNVPITITGTQVQPVAGA